MSTLLSRTRPSLRRAPTRPVGLDVDGSFLAAIELDGRTVARAASTDLPAGLVVEGEVADPDGLGEALRDFFKQHGLPREVRLGVSSRQIVLRQLELPPIAEESERAAAIRFQAAEAIAMPLEEAVLDFQSLGETVGHDGVTRERFIVVAARESLIASLVEAVRAAKLRPQGIDLNAFALVRTLAAATEQDEESARVYCHLTGVPNLAIAVGSTCLFTRPLAATAADEHADAAAIAEEVRLSIDFYMGQPDARWVGDVMLSGPGSAREGLSEEIADLIALPVSLAQPLGAVDPAGLPPGEDPRRHTVAAGLALGGSA